MGKVEPYPSESEAQFYSRPRTTPVNLTVGITGTCRDCKHWSGKNAALPPGKGFCNLAKNSKVNDNVQAPGGLITAPEFGCNQYKNK